MRVQLCIGLLLLSFNTFSQSIIRSTLSSLNTSELTSSVALHACLGQSSVSGTITSFNGIIRQGFQQPLNDVSTNTNNNHKPDFTVIVYPNPVSTVAHISIVSNEADSYKLKLRTMSGIIVWVRENVLGPTELRKDLLASGLYILEVRNETSISISKVVIE